MSLSIFKKLGSGDLRNTQVTLQLEDRSSVQPKGILEDVLVHVRDFIIPADFAVLDFKEGRDISILLGRHFLATFRSTIEFNMNELMMRINAEIETIKYGDRLDRAEEKRE